ncbi:MAG: NAD(P)H-dependent oxidoreductase [Candidatus Omnitrophica bacterium]|nr:NAD(P)H-dependent oxidoreductase [Candidatus Omnitrophota bacterium]MBU0881181.1 NAD(P)H-dependent oxidoreductase [Candidatus Omnitrophota bacterium]MBU0895756.1 NAD(P)H-dependent oxidoreductase [Candidatus Omnitrophota bacterium]MBU1038008.1 NAD(P)H-dependent oxidoreductase [Candidatus Omnitrophota bacterium]MBU1809262.1 NAD(P)H-dependent oxidoreductase [Candidatus Omnitrophota bacterium]
MRKILHIIATPRGDVSRTLKISGSFLESLKNKYPECAIDTLDLFKDTIPPLTLKTVSGKYVLLAGKDLSGDLKEAWLDIERAIARFLSADAYLISTPMWNFSIPYVLKHYIDVIIQPKYLFRYTDKDVEGLAKNKKMVIITSRGGDYSASSPFHANDYQEPYLRAIFGLVGIADIVFINAQPMDALGQGAAEEKIKQAQDLAAITVEKF